MMALLFLGFVILRQTNSLHHNSDPTYTLVNKEITNESIVLNHKSLFIYNSTLTDISIKLHGEGSDTVFIKDCILNGSMVVIDSIMNCSIKSSRFLAKDVSSHEQSRYMLNVLDANFVDIVHTVFSGSEEEMTKTELGINLTNITHAEITHCMFTHIRSEKADGSVLYITSSEVYVRHTEIVSNVARYSAIFLRPSLIIPSKMTNDNCSYRDNLSSNGGAAIYISKYIKGAVKCIIHCCTFTRNEVKGFAFGGAITCGNCEIIKSVFIANRNRFFGGAIAFWDRISVILHSTFLNNTAMNGAAVHADGFSLIYNCTFSYGYARNLGGALSITSHSINLIRSSVFNHNVAAVQGGTIYSTAGCTISDSMFSMNTARDGGVFRIRHLFGPIPDPMLINNTFTRNTGIIHKTHITISQCILFFKFLYH